MQEIENNNDEKQILIANSTLLDNNFKQAVLLIVEHEKDGSFGLVLNRYANVYLDDLIDGLPSASMDTPVMIGGPVGQNALFVLHDDESVEDPGEKIMNGVYLGSDKQLLEKLIEDPQANYIICYGYAGWGPGQLDEELKFNSWVSGMANKDFIFGVEPHQKWRTALINCGGIYSYYAQKVKDPFLN